MKKFFDRNKGLKRFAALGLCVCLLGTLVPFTAAAQEVEEVAPCDVAECKGLACVTEGCFCICHKLPAELDSNTVTVETETEPTEVAMVALVPAESVQETTDAESQETTETTQTTEATEPTETEATEETAEKTTEETTEETQPLVNPVTVTWLNQNGEVIAAAEKESGSVLAEEDFPAVAQVGWYLCGEENAPTGTPVKAGREIAESVVIRAVDRAVDLTVTGEFAVGAEVKLAVSLTGFAGEECSIRWQNCALNEQGQLVGDWADVEGAEGAEYTYTITEDAQNLSWRVVVTVQ